MTVEGRKKISRRIQKRTKFRKVDTEPQDVTSSFPFFSFHFVQGILRDIILDMTVPEGLFNQNNQYHLDFLYALITLY